MFRKMRRERQALPEKDIIQILEKGQTGVLAVCGDDGYPYKMCIRDRFTIVLSSTN